MKILHIEDNALDAELIGTLIAEEWPQCKIDVISSRKDLLSRLESDRYDLVLSDFSLGSFTGIDALKMVKERTPATPFIFVSGTIGEDRAIEALTAGAQDYVIKDRMKRLVTAIKRAVWDGKERRKRSEVEEQNREQAELLNKARDAIIVTNLEDRITFWNEGAERISGWKSSEVLGKRPEEVLGIGFHAKIDEARNALAEKGEWRGELQLHKKDGKTLAAEVSMTLIRDNEGRPKARLSIGTDITEKKILQEQFLRVQRLESIGMLASGIAHDLNNVLAPILMGAPLLRSRTTEPADQRMLETMENSAARGAALVRQVLSFAHGSQGERSVVQVRHVIRDIASLIRETFPKSIEFTTESPKDLWTVMSNATQLHQVLLNLCVNARDAMPNGGALRLDAENKVLDETASQLSPDAHAGPYLCLEVADTGSGIPSEALNHIWEPFFTTKAEGKGTGLGLATVRGIVANHRGFVTLESTPGKGTSFRVFLPASEESVASGKASESAHPFVLRGNGELVLIVDDEPYIRELAKVVLTRHGYRVLVAANGNDAIEQFGQRLAETALVVTDMNMPGMGGADLARNVQSLNEEVKVLFMSGAGSGATPANAGSSSIQVLKKPFTNDQLLKRVHDCLRPTASVR